ncbi:MAG TPA: hypothetical protein VK731_13585, partial [Candidatus Cybelea sp.]|nr:hypothetical protein [Candidatus Cybelea sp.]
MNYKLILIAVSLFASIIPVEADDVIDIKKPIAVPISVSDFQGEVESVLKFDLSVLGMEITTPDKAAYQVNGTQNGRLEGKLTSTGANQPMWARAYNGGTPRTQAHAFANDIVKEIRGTVPIFQGRIAFRLQEGSSTEIADSDFDGYDTKVLTHDGTLVTGASWVPGKRELLY